MKANDERIHTTKTEISFCNRSCSSAKRMCHLSVHPKNKSPNIIFVMPRIILSHKLMLWLIFCYIECSTGDRSKPLNRAAIKGEKVQLNCSTQQPDNGYWKFARPFQVEKRIYDGKFVVNGFKSIYTVDDSVRGHFNLLFTSSESSSGAYMCKPDLWTAEQSAEVIMLHAPPTCSHTVTSDIVNATCIINFTGNWAPEIEWVSMNGKLIETNDTIIIPNSRVISSVSASLSQSDLGELRILSCTPKFTIEGKPKATTATNVPEFPYNCTIIIESSTVAPSTQPNSFSSPSSPSTPLYIIGICVCVFVCVAAIVLTVMLRRRGKCGRNHRETKDCLIFFSGTTSSYNVIEMQTERSEFNQAEIEAEQIPYPMVSYENVDLPENAQNYLKLDRSQTQPPAIYTNLQ